MARITVQELNEMRESLDGMLMRSDELLDDLKENGESYKGAVSEVLKNKNNIQAIEKQIVEIHSELESESVHIENLTSSADELFKKVEQMSSEANQMADTLRMTNEGIDAARDEMDELIATIEGLLPGATSAGLASSFKDRKDSFKWPKILWGVAFIASMIALFLVAYYDPITLKPSEVNQENIFSFILARLPFAIPIVWLAIYAGRRHSQALRLEEEYAHKEALSKSFEGYKNQLLDIEEENETKSSTMDLISSVLEALSIHPGRVYQGKHEDITPLHSISTVFRRKEQKS